jgi:hypothetical protein
MESLVLILIISFPALIILAIRENRKSRNREFRARLLAEARQFMADVQDGHVLPTVPADIILKPGEIAFYAAPSVLYETRAVRHHQAGHAGFRVAKGVYVGGTSGCSVSNQEWGKIGAGRLTVTNKRLVFEGGGAHRSIPLKKTVSVVSSFTDVQVSAEGRQKTMAFEAANPLILAGIIRICCQVEDPLDFSQATLNVSFVEC